ncbi:hypothetical protein [Pseudomonas sp. Pc102]|uniref:hypothetical protein n=1 Tax=Pseudomonas sp. Pc102 TaxID=2678261 RepID=UPI001BD0250E|nr:hypothetical protein [Pseudomonas sp. Pc102]
MIKLKSETELNIVSAGKINKTILLSLLLISGCSADDCSIEVLGRTTSPNNKSEALTFERNCGATVGFVRGVAVISKGNDDEINDKSRSIFLIEGQSEISVKWLSDRELNVDYTGIGKAPFTETKNIDNIVVTYH